MQTVDLFLQGSASDKTTLINDLQSLTQQQTQTNVDEQRPVYHVAYMLIGAILTSFDTGIAFKSINTNQASICVVYPDKNNLIPSFTITYMITNTTTAHTIAFRTSYNENISFKKDSCFSSNLMHIKQTQPFPIEKITIKHRSVIVNLTNNYSYAAYDKTFDVYGTLVRYAKKSIIYYERSWTNIYRFDSLKSLDIDRLIKDLLVYGKSIFQSFERVIDNNKVMISKQNLKSFVTGAFRFVLTKEQGFNIINTHEKTDYDYSDIIIAFHALQNTLGIQRAYIPVVVSYSSLYNDEWVDLFETNETPNVRTGIQIRVFATETNTIPAIKIFLKQTHLNSRYVQRLASIVLSKTKLQDEIEKINTEINQYVPNHDDIASFLLGGVLCSKNDNWFIWSKEHNVDVFIKNTTLNKTVVLRFFDPSLNMKQDLYEAVGDFDLNQLKRQYKVQLEGLINYCSITCLKQLKILINEAHNDSWPAMLDTLVSVNNVVQINKMNLTAFLIGYFKETCFDFKIQTYIAGTGVSCKFPDSSFTSFETIDIFIHLTDDIMSDSIQREQQWLDFLAQSNFKHIQPAINRRLVSLFCLKDNTKLCSIRTIKESNGKMLKFAAMSKMCIRKEKSRWTLTAMISCFEKQVTSIGYEVKPDSTKLVQDMQLGIGTRYSGFSELIRNLIIYENIVFTKQRHFEILIKFTSLDSTIYSETMSALTKSVLINYNLKTFATDLSRFTSAYVNTINHNLIINLILKNDVFGLVGILPYMTPLYYHSVPKSFLTKNILQNIDEDRITSFPINEKSKCLVAYVNMRIPEDSREETLIKLDINTSMKRRFYTENVENLNQSVRIEIPIQVMQLRSIKLSKMLAGIFVEFATANRTYSITRNLSNTENLFVNLTDGNIVIDSCFNIFMEVSNPNLAHLVYEYAELAKRLRCLIVASSHMERNIVIPQMFLDHKNHTTVEIPVKTRNGSIYMANDESDTMFSIYPTQTGVDDILNIHILPSKNINISSFVNMCVEKTNGSIDGFFALSICYVSMLEFSVCFSSNSNYQYDEFRISLRTSSFDNVIFVTCDSTYKVEYSKKNPQNLLLVKQPLKVPDWLDIVIIDKSVMNSEVVFQRSVRDCTMYRHSNSLIITNVFDVDNDNIFKSFTVVVQRFRLADNKAKLRLKFKEKDFSMADLNRKYHNAKKLPTSVFL